MRRVHGSTAPVIHVISTYIIRHMARIRNGGGRRGGDPAAHHAATRPEYALAGKPKLVRGRPGEAPPGIALGPFFRYLTATVRPVWLFTVPTRKVTGCAPGARPEGT